MSNFVSDAVICPGAFKEGFLDELMENSLVKLFILIGSVAVAGYFIIMFGKEVWTIIFPVKMTVTI